MMQVKYTSRDVECLSELLYQAFNAVEYDTEDDTEAPVSLHGELRASVDFSISALDMALDMLVNLESDDSGIDHNAILSPVKVTRIAQSLVQSLDDTADIMRAPADILTIAMRLDAIAEMLGEITRLVASAKSDLAEYTAPNI